MLYIARIDCTYRTHTIQVVPSTVLEDEIEFASYLRAFNDR